MIDGEEPNDIWKSFRVGYRGRPYNVVVEDKKFSAHDSAYENRDIFWSRTVEILSEEKMIEVTDCIVNTGSPKTVEWNWHFAEGITYEATGALSGELQTPAGTLHFTQALSQVSYVPTESWFSAAFGVKTKRLCLNGRTFLSTGEHRFATRFGWDCK